MFLLLSRESFSIKKTAKLSTYIMVTIYYVYMHWCNLSSNWNPPFRNPRAAADNHFLQANMTKDNIIRVKNTV